MAEVCIGKRMCIFDFFGHLNGLCLVQTVLNKIL